MFLISKIKSKILKRRDVKTKQYLLDHGLIIGENVNINFNSIDGLYPWLIEIGSNIIFAPGVKILAHDASTKEFLNYTKIGRVNIGNNVFIGAESVVLPNVTIGDNVVIGANSTVTKDIPSNSVYAGNPAKFICTIDEYIEKNKRKMEDSSVYGEEYTLRANVDEAKKKKMYDELENKMGFVD